MNAKFLFFDWVLLPFLMWIGPLFSPIDKEVIHVRNFNQTYNSKTQYPILDFVGLVERHGYTAEEHILNTTDGYILTLHRISGSPKSPKAPNKPVVYLQHGIFLSSDSWVLTGPNNALPFLLADAGKDVWIGNVRGNTYSQNHTDPYITQSKFWRFGFHEMAVYDIRTFVDYMLKTTGQQDLTYIGYSMGTTLSYILLSVLPEYNAKVKLLYSIAPAVYWKHELRKLSKGVEDNYDDIDGLIKHYDLQRLLPQTALSAWLGKTFCGDKNPAQEHCAKFLASSIGLDLERLNKTALPEIFAHFPAGTSTVTAYNSNQNYKKDKFQAFDYGYTENLAKYGQETPPVYNITKVTAPIVIWYAKSDDIINYEDVLYLKNQLPNVVSINAVAHPNFNHFDFLWANDVKQLVYDKLVN